MYYGLNRTICDVLKEMRVFLALLPESHNKLVLRSLVEEVQVMGNRMEAKLNEIKDLEHYHDEIREARNELKALKAEIKANTELKQLIK